jgi:hypothetical protein
MQSGLQYFGLWRDASVPYMTLTDEMSKDTAETEDD